MGVAFSPVTVSVMAASLPISKADAEVMAVAEKCATISPITEVTTTAVPAAC